MPEIKSASSQNDLIEEGNKNQINDDLDLSESFTNKETEEIDLSDNGAGDKLDEKKSQKALNDYKGIAGGESSSNKDDENENIAISRSKMVLVKNLLANIKENNDRLIQLLSGLVSDKAEESISIGQMSDEKFQPSESETTEGRIIEGVFDGENMIGPDGKQYSVPANYASKSKLVEGDILKLTITPSGTFVYKQIRPIERSRLIGQLEQDNNGSFMVVADGKKLRVLTASVTYFKGQADNEVIVLVPKTGESKWAAVENIVRKHE